VPKVIIFHKSLERQIFTATNTLSDVSVGQSGPIIIIIFYFYSQTSMIYAVPHSLRAPKIYESVTLKQNCQTILTLNIELT